MELKKYPWFHLSLLVVFIIAPLFFLPQLKFDNSPVSYLPADQPAVKLDRKIRELFPEDQVAVVLFQGAALYGDEFLNSLHKATKSIEQSSLVDRVINVTEMEHIGGSDEGFDVAPLLGEKRRLSLVSDEARFQFAIKDRFASGTVVAKTKDYMALVVRPHKISSTSESIELMDYVDQKLIEFKLKRFVVAYAGGIPVEIAQFKSMVRDSLIFVPATALIGMLLIWLMFHRILAVVMSALVTGATVYMSLLLFVVTSLPYTMISAMLPAFLAALSTAFLIHFYNSIQLAASLSLHGKDRIAFAMKNIRKPIFFTALTTVLGLCSLAISPIPPIIHFGLIAAAGVTFLTFIVLKILPGIFVAMDHSPWHKAKKKRSIIDRLLKKLLVLSIRKAGWVLAIGVIALLIGLPGVLNIKAETNMLEFFLPGHKITTDTALVEDKLNGVVAIEIELYGDSRDSLKKSAPLRQIKQLTQWLEQQMEIDKVNSLVDIVEDMHKAMHENQQEYLKIPDNDQLISQYFFIYDGNDVYEFVNREFDHTRVLLSVNEHSSRRLTQLIERISGYLAENIDGLKWDVAGEARLFADEDSLLVQGQIKSLIVAVCLIALVMFILWRDMMSTLLTMLPNLFPIIAIFILMGFSGIKLDMATAMIASVAIGVAVDDTIHLFHDYKKRRDKGCSNIYALVQSYYKTGRALIITTIILCTQFLMLSLSQFVPTANFGLLTSMALFMALIFDIVFLPSILVLIYRNKNRI